jgi:hypothetical protein
MTTRSNSLIKKARRPLQIILTQMGKYSFSPSQLDNKIMNRYLLDFYLQTIRRLLAYYVNYGNIYITSGGSRWSSGLTRGDHSIHIFGIILDREDGGSNSPCASRNGAKQRSRKRLLQRIRGRNGAERTRRSKSLIPLFINQLLQTTSGLDSNNCSHVC